MTQEDYIRKLRESRQVNTDLELEVVALFDAGKRNVWLIRKASEVIDRLKECPKKVKLQ